MSTRCAYDGHSVLSLASWPAADINPSAAIDRGCALWHIRAKEGTRMLRTAANRAGCLFCPEILATARPWTGPMARVEADAWTRPSRATEAATPERGGWQSWLKDMWRWLQSWWSPAAARAPMASAAPEPSQIPESPELSGTLPVPPPPAPAALEAAARALAAQSLQAHPVDISDSDDEAAWAPENSVSWLAGGLAVAPRAARLDAPAGVQVGFNLERSIAAPMHAIAQVICDSSRGHLWIDRCVESRLLDMTTSGPIAYHRYQLPLVGDRDSVTRSTITQVDADTLQVVVQPWGPDAGSSDADADADTGRYAIACPEGTVRLPWVCGSFTLHAESPTMTHVAHASRLVLGGGIPRLLAPVIRRKSPKHTLNRLAALVEASSDQASPATA